MAIARRSSFSVPRQWSKRQVPTWPVEIADNHPLAAGLISAWLPGVLINKDLKYYNTPSATNITQSTDAYGPAASFSTSSIISGNKTVNVAEITHSVWFNVPSSSKTSNGALCGLQQGGSFDKIISISASGDIVWYVFNGATIQISAGIDFCDGKLHLVSGVYNSSSGSFLYVDGVLRASSATSGASFTGYSAPNFSIGGNLGGNYAAIPAWACSSYMLHNRGVTAAEAALLYAEPFGVLRPVVRRDYFAPVGSANFTISLTAAQGQGSVLRRSPSRLLAAAQVGPTAVRRVVARRLAASSTETAATSRSVGRSYAAAATESASLGRNPNRSFSAGQQNSSATSRVVRRVFSVAMTAVGSASRSVGRLFAAAQGAPAATLRGIARRLGIGQAAGAAIGRTAVRNFGASQGESATESRVTGRTMTAAQVTSVSIGRSVVRLLAAGQGGLSLIARAISRGLRAAQGESAASSVAPAKIVSLSAGQAAVSSLRRLASRVLSVAQQEQAATARAPTRRLSAAQQSTAAFSRGSSQTIVVSTQQPQASAATTTTARSFAATQLAAASIFRRIARLFGFGQSTRATATLPVMSPVPRRILSMPPDLRWRSLPPDIRWQAMKKDR